MVVGGYDLRGFCPALSERGGGVDLGGYVRVVYVRSLLRYTGSTPAGISGMSYNTVNSVFVCV